MSFVKFFGFFLASGVVLTSLLMMVLGAKSSISGGKAWFKVALARLPVALVLFALAWYA